ncbi:hypothetical protein ACHAXT_010851 [Thalassiosira profunda]
MTVPANDDPEIVVEGTDPAPSAPPAAISSTLPTVIATPVTSASTPAATAPPLAAATTTNAGGNVERTTNADGSLTVRITTTRTQPNGYREVTTEHFHIPAGVVSTVALSLDQGDPPSSLYMTRMEQQTLPPGTGEVTTRPPAYPTPGFENNTQTQQHQPDAPASQESNDDSAANRNRRHALGGVLTGIVAVFIIALGISGSSDNNNSPSWSPPSPSYTPWPSPSSPSWPSHPWSSPSHPIWHDSPTASPYPTSATPWPVPTWPSWPSPHLHPWSSTPYPTRSTSPTASPAPTTTNWWKKPVDEWPVSSRPTTWQEGKRKRKEERKKEKGVTSAPASPPEVERAPPISPGHDNLKRHDGIDLEVKK